MCNSLGMGFERSWPAAAGPNDLLSAPSICIAGCCAAQESVCVCFKQCLAQDRLQMVVRLNLLGCVFLNAGEDALGAQSVLAAWSGGQ